MKTSHAWAICVAALVCLHLGSSFTNGAETGNPFYTYDNGPVGPARWGDYPGWETCKTGRMQSPMVITPNISVLNKHLDEKLDTDYPKGKIPATISNNGHTVELAVEGLFKLEIDGVEYESTQMHFHYPSEHTIFGYQFALELHLVHVSASGKIAVIGWLFTLGKDSPFLNQFFDKLPTYTPGVEAEEHPIDIKFTLSTEGPYGRYMGSLTTPPCSEGVTWTLMLWDFPTVSEKQLAQLKAVLSSPNARPTQPPYGRKFYVSQCHD